MAGLLEFFMYLPVLFRGIQQLKRYLESKCYSSAYREQNKYCLTCLMDGKMIDEESGDWKSVDPATHEHKDSIYVRTDPQLL